MFHQTGFDVLTIQLQVKFEENLSDVGVQNFMTLQMVIFNGKLFGVKAGGILLSSLVPHPNSFHIARKLDWGAVKE